MFLSREIRRHARLVAGPVAGIGLVVYFSYHLVEGDRGLVAWSRLSEQIRVADQQLAQSEAERTTLEKRVSLLRPNHIDPDLLDEEARAVLNRVGPDERVIFAPRPAE
ncbi:MAG TPA: septum formation initiator family protein [Stellaceae bacterium]|nr:septum formation initiator family protein [Stellaceae bacterium]